MERLTADVAYVDLKFRQIPRIIATAVLQAPGGVALLDPGPTSTLPTLRRELADAGIAMQDVNTILLTHIHLDHAGSTGTLVHENPNLKVYVHSLGAPHLVNPEKLLASAARLYGDEMDLLWGEVRPVPPQALITLTGGERLKAAGRELAVEYTPGHASHHVSYFSADTGIAFIGDVAGIKRTVNGYVLPPTPPPDINPEFWNASLEKIAAWRPDTLFLTHFGPSSPSAGHLAELAENLTFATNLVSRSLASEGSDQDREIWFTEQIRLELRRRLGETDARPYEVAGRFDLNWRGLARYLRKKEGGR